MELTVLDYLGLPEGGDVMGFFLRKFSSEDKLQFIELLSLAA